jgi:cation:H+ antiporter
MIALVTLGLAGIVLLVLSTDIFVRYASRVAEGMRVSSVLVGAVILGCGVGLPEFALAFHGVRESPLRQLGIGEGDGHGMALLVVGVVLVVILTYPLLFPDRARRHSPFVIAATVLFAALLRGSLDRIEGVAMLAGFAIGVAWVLHAIPRVEHDVFDPQVDDVYENSNGYIEAPVMTPVQKNAVKAMVGLVGTLIGAQLLARSAQEVLQGAGYSEAIQGLVIVGFGSMLPHVVVALQALRHHHEGLAVGNMIGSNLFHTLAVGGLVSVIKPYEKGGVVDLSTLAILVATAAVTYLLLHSEEEIARWQGFGLMVGYVVLAAVAVP